MLDRMPFIEDVYATGVNVAGMPAQSSDTEMKPQHTSDYNGGVHRQGYQPSQRQAISTSPDRVRSEGEQGVEEIELG